MAAMINQTASFRVVSCNTRPSKTLQKGSVCWVESVMGKLLLYHSHQTYCNNAFLRNICSPRKERKMKPREEEVSRAVLVQAQAQQKNAEKDDWAASRRSSGRCPPRGRDTAGEGEEGSGPEGPGSAELPQRPRILTLGCFLAWLTITRNIAAAGEGLPHYPAPETVLPLLRPSPNVTGGPRRGRCPLPGCSSSGGCLFACR